MSFSVVIVSLLLVARAAFPAEPVGRPVNLWPFFHKQRTTGGLQVEALFSLISYKRELRKIDLAVRPFYWRHADPEARKARTDFLWPLGMREVDGDVVRTRVLPLFWRRWAPKEIDSVLFPLYHYRLDGSRRQLGLLGYLPFTAVHLTRDDEAGLVSRRWLIWTQDRSPEASALRLPPLFTRDGDRSGERRHVSALGAPEYFNLFERRLDRSQGLAEWHALTVWSREAPGDNYLHVWPFYGRRVQGSSLERSTLWPFFRYRVDPAAGESDLHAFWPLAAFEHRADFERIRILPFYASSRRLKGWEAPSLLGLGLASPVPLWYRATGEGHDYRRFFWLYWRVDTPELRRHVAVPWYFFENRRAAKRHFGLFPLYHGSRWRDGALDLALPLFASYRAGGTAATVLPPLYFRFASQASTTTAVLPFYYDRRAGEERLRVLFPFYYQVRDAEKEVRYFFPLYGTTARGGKTHKHFLLFPLFSRTNDEARGLTALDIAWPLFHVERSSAAASTRILPLYWSSSAGDSRFRMLFPLYWDSEGPTARHRYVLPLLYGDFERKDVLRVRALGPVYWRIDRSDISYRRDDFLLSLYSRTNSDGEIREHFFPFYWRKSAPGQSYRRFPPLGGFERSDDGDRDLFFLGFTPSISLLDFRRSVLDQERVDRALLYYRRESREASATAFVPLYFRWRDADEKALILFPLWAQREDLRQGDWHRAVFGIWGGYSLIEFTGDRSGEHRSSRVLLFYDRQNQDERFTFFAPLYWRSSDAVSDWNQCFPLFAASRDDSAGERAIGVLGVTPRWSLFRWQTDKEETSSGLWPLYGSTRRHDGKSGSFHALGFHPKIAAFTRETDGDSTDVRVLFRLLRWRRSAESSNFEFNPFFYRTRDGGVRYWAILGGLFGVETQADGSREFTWFWQ